MYICYPVGFGFIFIKFLYLWREKIITIMNTAYIIIGLVFIVLGFLVKRFPVLIAGYNTMSKEQKENVDVNGLGRYMRWCLICLGCVVIALSIIFTLLHLTAYLSLVIIVLLFVVLPFVVVGATKYDHNEKRRPRIIYVAFIVIFIVLVVSGCTWLLIYGSKPTVVSVNDFVIRFEGMERSTLKVTAIASVELTDSIPAIRGKVRGFDYMSVRKGNFRLNDYGICKMYTHSSKGPYILIKTIDDKTFIINYKEPEKVKELYDRICAAQTRGYIVKIGDMVPNFDIVTPDGVKVNIDSLRGKVVMLQFTASWCVVCRREMPHIESDIWLKLKDNSQFALYGIDLKETPEEIAAFTAAIPVTYPVALDPEGAIFGLFCEAEAGVTRNIILDRTGKIIKLTRLYDEAEFSSMVELINRELAKE